MQDTPIARLMTRRVERVGSESPLAEVVARMTGLRFSCLVVCDGMRPVGMISERDLVGALGSFLAGGEATPKTAGEVMSTPLVTIGRSTPVAEALETMREQGFRRLPVTDAEGGLVGIVTQSDVLRAHTRQLEALHQRLEESVARRTHELMGVVERLETLSLQDALLEIGNRRAMEATLDRVHQAAARYGRPDALVLLDVDRFKSFNDHYGHAAGDRVLKQIAVRLGEALRRSDAIFRYGGEEILAVLPEAGPEEACAAAERLRSAVEGLAIPHVGSTAAVVTVSCGVAAWQAPSERGGDWRTVVERADRALYRAKDAGRNRVATDPVGLGEQPFPAARAS